MSCDKILAGPSTNARKKHDKRAASLCVAGVARLELTFTPWDVP